MKNENKGNLQANIRKYRLLGKRDGIEHCRTSAAFAAYIGLNPKTYKNYEAGAAVPDYNNLVKIAAALGLPSMDMLFDYEAPQDNQVRFFLDDLGIPFRVKINGKYACKEYVLDLPDKVKNDVRTWERMTLDVDAAEVKIYQSPSLRWKYDWFGRGKITLSECEFFDIIPAYREQEAQLKTLARYPFARQLLFLGLAKAYNDLDIGDPDEEAGAEYYGLVSFLLDLEKFMDNIRTARTKEDWNDIRKENDTWIESDYLQLQDEMNSRLSSEQLREIFLDLLENVYKNNGRGGIKIIRQRIQDKK